MSDNELEARMRRLEHLMTGNGEPGVVQRLRDLEGYMYKDPQTGEPGLVKDVRDIKAMVRGANNWIKGAAAAVGLGAVSGAAVAIRWLIGG